MTAIRKALLLYNPHSGRRHSQRLRQIESLLRIFHDAGVEAFADATVSASETPLQVKAAIIRGCDAVIACGGDGTIHDIVQGLAASNVALGIIPLGTANTLAHDLSIPLTPSRAAASVLAGSTRRTALGHIFYRNFAGDLDSRYFAICAGIGMDAHALHLTNPAIKRHLGISAYHLQALRAWLTHDMQCFAIEVRGASNYTRAEVSQLLAVRISNFGGALGRLAPRASLDQSELQLVLFRTASRIAYLQYVLAGLISRNRKVRGVDLTSAAKVRCAEISEQLASNQKRLVQADGELLGTLPAEITIIPDALTIIAPEPKRHR